MQPSSKGDNQTTLLRLLLRDRHWQTHSTFTKKWDETAQSIDKSLIGSWPRHAQFYRWLRGDIRDQPYSDACRVLEAMFPEYSVQQLFQPIDSLNPLLNQRSLSHPYADAGISMAWPRTNTDSSEDLIDRVKCATKEISVFGLTRNFYATDELLPLFEEKATAIPFTFYVMEPSCSSRQDRYRLEPVEAAMEDRNRYNREVLRPLLLAAERISCHTESPAGMHLFTYNFPCSFAIERIDDSCRVMLYGHGKRGTEGPIFVFERGTPFWDYFDSQIKWLERLATDPREPWISKGLAVRPLTEAVIAV